MTAPGRYDDLLSDLGGAPQRRPSRYDDLLGDLDRPDFSNVESGSRSVALPPPPRLPAVTVTPPGTSMPVPPPVENEAAYRLGGFMDPEQPVEGGEFTKGIARGVGGAIESTGQAASALGRLIEPGEGAVVAPSMRRILSKAWQGAGPKVSEVGAGIVERQGEAQVPTMADIESPRDVVPYVQQAIGQGIGSTLPSLLGAGAGGASAAGRIAGALAPSYLQNYGGTEAELRRANPDIDQRELDWKAALLTAPVAGLESAADASIAGRFAKGGTGGFWSRVARAVAGGSAKEGVTEAVQQGIQYGGARVATGTPIDAREMGTEMLEAGVQGALAGGVFGGTAAARPARPAVTPPAAVEPDAPVAQEVPVVAEEAPPVAPEPAPVAEEAPPAPIEIPKETAPEPVGIPRAEGEKRARDRKPGEVNVVRFPVAELVPDPGQLQYKQGLDPTTGAHGELSGLEFDETLAGVVSVWRDPETGVVHPVNGHHRVELAQRTGHESLNVQFIEAKTAKEARAVGAIQNIAEGRGTAIDAATFFRDADVTPADIASKVSLKGAIAKQGAGLAKLERDIFDRVVRGELEEKHGAVIGEMLSQPEQQRAAAKAVAGKRLSEGEVREVAAQVRDAESVTVKEMSLFGEEEIAQSLFVEKAQLAEGIKKKIAQDKRLFGAVAKEGRAEELARGGNVIDVEASRRIADEAARAAEGFARLYTKAGPVATALTEAARRVAKGEKLSKVIDDIYPSIRDATEASLREALAGRKGESAGPSGAASESGDAATAAAVDEGPGLFGEPEKTVDTTADDLAAVQDALRETGAPEPEPYHGVPDPPGLDAPRREMIGAGQNLVSKSDRPIAPFPKVKGSPSQRIQQVDEWLWAEALKEAESMPRNPAGRIGPATTGEFQADLIRNMRQKDGKLKLTPAERSDLNVILFGHEEGPQRLHFREGPPVPPVLDSPEKILGSPAAATPADVARIAKKWGMDPKKTVGKVMAGRRIVEAASEMLGLPVWRDRGNLKGRRALGAFWTFRRSVRLLRKGDVRTWSHEVGHYISDVHDIKKLVRSLATKQQRGAAWRELVAAGRRLYGNRKPAGGYGEEGIAEAALFYVDDPARLAQEFPTFLPVWEEMLKNDPTLKRVLDWTRDRWQDQKASSPDAHIDSMIAEPSWARYIPDGEDLVIGAIDDLEPLRRAREELGGVTSIDDDPYHAADVARSISQAQADLQYGIDLPNGKQTMGFVDILRMVGRKNLRSWRNYLVAERALELLNRGIETGFESAKLHAKVQEGRQNKTFVAAAEKLYEFSDAMEHKKVEAGLMTEATFQAFRDKNKKYVPFNVFFDPKTPVGRGGGKGLAKNTSGTYAIKGSDGPKLDPLIQIVHKATETYALIGQHQATVKLYELAVGTEGGARIMEELPEIPQDRHQASMAKLRKVLEAEGIDVDALDQDALEGALVAYWDRVVPTSKDLRDRAFPMLYKGKRIWVQVNDVAVFKALAGLTDEERGVVEKVAGPFSRLLRLGATAWEPSFLLAINPIRDALTGSVFSRAGYRPPGWHFALGMIDFARLKNGGKGTFAEMFLREGGGSAGRVGADVATKTKALERLIDEGVALNTTKAIRALRHPLRALATIAEISEIATRIGEAQLVYQKAIREGKSESEARKLGTQAGRELTLNFQRAGRYARVANQLYPFLNTRMQGTRKFLVEHDPSQVKTPEGRARLASILIRGLVNFTLPSLVLYMLNHDEEDEERSNAYDDIPEWLKMTGFTILDEEGNGKLSLPYTGRNGKRYKVWWIPRPDLMGVVYGYLPEKMLDYLKHKDPKAFEEMGKALMESVAPTTTFLPQMIGPATEALFNYRALTESPVEPKSTERWPAAERASPQTGETARALALLFSDTPFETSPAKIEHVAYGYTGGVGKLVGGALDAGVRAARDVAGMRPLRAEADVPGFKAYTPVLKRLQRDLPAQQAKSVQEFYDRYDEAEGHRLKWRTLRGEERQEYLREHPEIRDVFTEDEGGPGRLRRARTQMDEVNERRRTIRNLNITAEERSDRLRAVDARALSIARDLRKRAEERRKQPR